MSLWKCKADGGELGPVSFKELAALVREGKVKDGALVCREGGVNWEPVWHVPGLMNAAGIAEPGDSIPTPESPIQDPVTESPKDATVSRSGDARGKHSAGNRAAVRASAAGAAAVFLTGAASRWAYWKMAAFPPKQSAGESGRAHFFPLVGQCDALECVLLYLDLFALAAAAAWFAWGWVESKLHVD